MAFVITGARVGIGGMATSIGAILFLLLIGYTLKEYEKLRPILAGYNIIFHHLRFCLPVGLG